MDDILSQGGDREPRRWPRRLTVIAALVALAVASAVYISLPRHAHTPVAGPSAPVTANPAPSPSLSPPPAPVVEAALPGETNGIAGPTLRWPSGLRVPLARAQPAWFSPASGRSEPIGGLPRARSGYHFIRGVGGWAVQAKPAATAGCASCAGAPAPVWFLADGARSVTRVGLASMVAPAAAAGAVWLTRYPPGVSIGSTAGMAREVSTTGVPLGPPVRLPSGYVIDQATDRGLLLAPVGQPSGAPVDKLLDPATRQVSRTFAAVIAASPTEVAWTSACASTCRIQVLDLATGRRTTVRLSPASSAASGAFSPGGEFLALQASSANTGDGGALAMQLEVASVASGRLTVVPGTFVSSDALVGYGWPAGGDSLVAEFIFTTKVQLASWHPGATRPAVAVIRTGTVLDSLTVG